MNLNNRRTGKDAMKPHALGLLGHCSLSPDNKAVNLSVCVLHHTRPCEHDRELLFSVCSPNCVPHTSNEENFDPVFKTGQILLYLTDYVTRLESGCIQDWVNQLHVCLERK